MSDEYTDETGRYEYIRVHLCHACKEGFKRGDRVVSVSDGHVDKNQDYDVMNRCFWHRDCWEDNQPLQTDTQQSGEEQ